MFSGCSSEEQLIKKYENIFEPVEQQSINSYYVSGLPYGVSDLDSFNIIFNLQPADVLGDEYLRLWFYIENKSKDEVLFIPSEEFKLIFEKKNIKYEVKPESPLKILKEIDQEKQSQIINQSIAASLKSISKTSTTITNSDNNDKIELNDVDEKRDKISSELSQSITNTENWYHLYSESFNQGVLRKSTLFQNKSVNGFIYFNLPIKKKIRDWNTANKYIINRIHVYELNKYNIYLVGQNLLNKLKIKFLQVKGE